MQQPREWPADAPDIRSPKVTLLAWVDDGPVWATKIGDKRDILEQTEGLLWGFWKGEHSAHLFEIDRAQAELEICTGPERSRSVDPGVEALLAWFTEQAAKQGFLNGGVDHVSHATPEVTAAKRLLADVPKAKIAAVGQFALTDERFWRGKVVTVGELGRHWNRLVPDWENRGGAAPYDPDYVMEAAGGD